MNGSRPPDGLVRRLFRISERPPSVPDAVELEIRHHIETRAELLVETEGLSEDEALREAERRFGDVARVRREMEGGEHRHRRARERSRVARQTVDDVRFALRALRKSPGFAGVAVLTLALGIGLNTAIFSVVKGVLLDPLPYPDAGRLVWGESEFGASRGAAVSPPDYLDYRESATSFEYLGGRRGGGSYTLTGFDAPEIVRGQSVTAELLDAFGRVPLLGRSFTRDDELEGARAVVLSHAFWQSRFGGDPDVVGRTLSLDDEPWEVVGVMPAGFATLGEADFWRPIPLHTGSNLVRRFHNLRLVGRLRPGVTLEGAQAELDLIAARLEREYPESNATWRLVIQPLREFVVGPVRTGLEILWGAVALVLLIVCANVANLLLARGTGRRTEIAVRTALGASRGRIVRLLLTESLALAGLGCVAGVGLAVLGVRLLRAIEPGTLPRIEQIGLDGWGLAFAIGVSLLTGLVFGLLPALAAARPDLTRALKAGGRGGSGVSGRVRGALVVGEVALSFVLLIGAGLLLRSFARLVSVDPGFRTEGAVTASLSLPAARFEGEADVLSFDEALETRLEAFPGVSAVGFTSQLPLAGPGNDTYMAVPGRHQLGTETQFNAQIRSASRGFFEAMGIPLLRGRAFTEADRAGAPPVVIVNRPFVETIFPDEDPVGRRLLIDLGEPLETEVIGVVGGVHEFGLGDPPPMTAYFPLAQATVWNQQVVIRTSGDPASVVAALPELVGRIDPLQPVGSVATYESLLGRSVARPRFQALLLGLFAAVALTLAVVGIYGVLSYLVARRSREVGIRIALGATRPRVIGLIVRRGLGLAGAGLAIGALAALGLTRFMESLLYGVTATDGWTFAGVAALLGLTSLAACYLPARRAAGVDPTTTLRQE